MTRRVAVSGILGGSGAGTAVAVKSGDLAPAHPVSGERPHGSVRFCPKCKKDLRRGQSVEWTYEHYCSGLDCLWHLAKGEHLDIQCLFCHYRWPEALP